MATLHVRNVPDGLYERLRECAAANGRSIGAEVVVLIERELVTDIGRARTRPYGRAPRRLPKSPFQHFDPRARQVIVDARGAALELGAAGIGTGHLLLALLQAPPNLASVLLEQAGITHALVRASLGELAGEAAQSEPGGLPFAPETKKALELALRESINLRAVEIGPEHLLLGIARSGEGAGAAILADSGQTAATLRSALRALDLPAAINIAPPAGSGFRVVDLKGSAEEWERQLNTHAAAGHELVDIVEKRAIFRVPA
jgi:Clp amino terminal domain, pathogenicity island component